MKVTFMHESRVDRPFIDRVRPGRWSRLRVRSWPAPSSCAAPSGAGPRWAPAGDFRGA